MEKTIKAVKHDANQLIPIVMPYNLELYPDQKDIFKAFFKYGYRNFCVVMHRRYGKTMVCCNLLFAAALSRVGNYVYAFPHKTTARTNFWRALDSEGVRYLDRMPQQLIMNQNNTEMLIELINGSTIQCIGVNEDPNKIRGAGPIGIIFDEYALQNPEGYHVASPILVRNKGWAAFVYTPKGNNHGYKLYQMAKNNPDFYVTYKTVEDTRDQYGNPIITREEIESERRKGIPEELIQQEYYCDWFSANVGAVYSNYLKDLIARGDLREFEINPSLPTFTFWDIGRSDSTAIIFVQIFQGKIYIVNYYEKNFESFYYHINYVKRFAKENNIIYSGHWFPHDIKVTDYTSEFSRLEHARKEGIEGNITPNIPIEDGVNTARMLFKKIVINEKYCKRLLTILQTYGNQFDEKNQCVKEELGPKWASHGADTFRYMSVVMCNHVFSAEQKTSIRKYVSNPSYLAG